MNFRMSRCRAVEVARLGKREGQEKHGKKVIRMNFREKGNKDFVRDRLVWQSIYKSQPMQACKTEYDEY